MKKLDLKSLRFDTSSASEFKDVLNARVNHYFKKRGGHRRATPWAWAKLIFVMTAFWSNWAAITLTPHSVATTVGLLAIQAILYMTIAYTVGHDAVHGTLTGKPKIDGAIYWLSFNVLGANSYLWRTRHNHGHHFIVNIPGWDLDIEGTKAIRLAPHVPWMKIHRYQHIYTSFLYMIFTLHWIVFKDFKVFFMDQIGNKQGLKHSKWRLVEMVFLKALYFTYTLVIPTLVLPYSFGQILTTFVLFHFAFSYLITLSFAYSHVGVDAKFVFPDETGKLPHSFYEHQLLTSIDFHPTSHVAGFVYGGFSAHVAHHMFPGIHSIHYPELTKIIAKTTKEFGLPYYEHNLWQMVVGHYRFLKKMGEGPDAGAEHCVFPKNHRLKKEVREVG